MQDRYNWTISWAGFVSALEPMKRKPHTLDEVEVTAWVLIAIFLLVLILFTYLFWKRVSPEFPRTSQSTEVLKVAVCSDPRIRIWPPPPAIPGKSPSQAVQIRNTNSWFRQGRMT